MYTSNYLRETSLQYLWETVSATRESPRETFPNYIRMTIPNCRRERESVSQTISETLFLQLSWEGACSSNYRRKTVPRTISERLTLQLSQRDCPSSNSERLFLQLHISGKLSFQLSQKYCPFSISESLPSNTDPPVSQKGCSSNYIQSFRDAVPPTISELLSL